MRLINLHVDNFGKLSNYNLDLNNDLNSILQDNGWGKTTLAFFIKAMLYGLNSNKSKDLDKNERSKFAPWNNGFFGGTLEFEYKNNNYRIERSFGKKESDDCFKVFDLKTNKEVTNSFLPSVGDKIFQIDGESFEKSMFIPQKDFDFQFNETLTSKLTNLFGNLDDCKSAVEGREKIEVVNKDITKKSGGRLVEITREIQKLDEVICKKEKDIEAIPQIEEGLKDCDNNITLIRNQINDIDGKFLLLAEVAEKQANKKIAESKQKEIKEKEGKISEYSALLSNKASDEIDVESLEILNNEINTFRVKKQTIQNSSFDVVEYEKLKGIFYEHPLDEKTIKDIKNQINRYNSFKPQVAINEAPAINKKKVSPLIISLLTIGAVVMIAGFALIAFILIAGIICAFLGLIGLICGLVMYLTKNNGGNINSTAYVPNDDPEKLIIENSLKEFFNQYKLYGMNFDDNITELIRKWEDFIALKAEFENRQELIKQLELNIADSEEKLTSKLMIFKLASVTISGKINEIRDLINTRARLMHEIESEKKKYTEFCEENRLNEEDAKIDFDKEELSNTKKALNETLENFKSKRTHLLNDLDVLNESLTTIEEDRNHKLSLQQEKSYLTHRAEILGAAIKFIDETNELIKAKYVEPMKNNVKKYMDQMLKTETLDFNVDTDFKFNGLQDNKQKEIKFYSKGYQQAISICLRLALIDCLFKSEKPFLLLDDPFVDLDGNKLAQAKNMLKELSKNIQVTYLTCHESRNI